MQAIHHRRAFLAALAGGGAGLALGGCGSTHPAPQPRLAAGAKPLTIVDTHTHFYDPTRPQGVPWPSRAEPRLYRTILPPTYLALPVPQKVAGTVVVEASPWIEDNQWVLELAEREPFIIGLVGNLPVGERGFGDHLKRFAAHKRFRGLRIRERKLDGVLADAAFVSDLKLLAAHDLSLDLVGGAEIPPFAERLAAMVPDLRIVIDHLAGVRIDGGAPPAPWLEGMRSLARCPNIYCKVSGLVEGSGRRDGTAPRDVEFYRPVLDAMWTMFGPGRLLYGSNWPVSELYAPLATVQGIVSDYFRAKGRAAEEQIFAGTARTVYRWTAPYP